MRPGAGGQGALGAGVREGRAAEVGEQRDVGLAGAADGAGEVGEVGGVDGQEAGHAALDLFDVDEVGRAEPGVRAGGRYVVELHGQDGGGPRGETGEGREGGGFVAGVVAGVEVGVGLGSGRPESEQPYSPAAVSAHSSAVRTRPGRLAPRSPVM